MDNKDKIIKSLNEDYRELAEKYKKLLIAYEEQISINLELEEAIEELEEDREYI